MDAALATAIALTVVEPVSNGIGSDAFALVWDGHELHGLNGSGRAPAALSIDAVQELGYQSIPDVGPVVAKSLRGFFSSVLGRRRIERLRAAGLKMEKPERTTAALAPFSGMTFVFTGELTALTRASSPTANSALTINLSTTPCLPNL